MRASDVQTRVLVKSGQYIAPFDATLLSDDEFLVIIEEALNHYNRYKSFSEDFEIVVSQGCNVFEFESTREDRRDIPKWVSDVRIPKEASSSGKLPGRLMMGRDRYSRFERKVTNFMYRKPKLHVPYSGVYHITAHFDRWIETVADIDEVVSEVKNITSADIHFFDLATAQFLMYLGRSRRAFTLDGIPVTFDASEMINDGERLFENTIEKLSNTDSNWHDVILG